MVRYKIPIIGHTLDYLLNAENFLAECRQQYGDPFNIYVFGQVFTIVGNEIAHETYHADIFSLSSATRDTFPLYRVLKSLDDPETMEQVIKTIREGITAKLPLYTGRMQKQLVIYINKEIGDCSKPKLINTAADNFSSMIARPVADVLVGQNYLKPLLEKRLEDKKILGDKYEPTLDIIEYFMNDHETKVITDDYLNKICDFLFVTVVASIHTTARQLTSALYDFAGRPELWDDLYEEQVKIDKECNGELSPQHINKMVKLDSFLRESLRTFDAKCLESYTFKNGMTVPKGRMVLTYLSDIHYNTTAYGPEPRSFLPYHGLENNIPASKTDKNYFIFGSGKHACPGSGKIEKKIRFGPLTEPPATGLIFENRKK
ncbi:9232_t:CDS:10 [Diversispora eburnea]|uniref:9232_t:CDS:1 n=1 Tax=Diversispora eburnea TaxID=1213867 RepID=A0A9N9C1M2_9GLOM|nr:9232_t:CDS:10 [Diversispora eburnea]